MKKEILKMLTELLSDKKESVALLTGELLASHRQLNKSTLEFKLFSDIQMGTFCLGNLKTVSVEEFAEGDVEELMGLENEWKKTSGYREVQKRLEELKKIGSELWDKTYKELGLDPNKTYNVNVQTGELFVKS
ncbi:hypothetical protein [Paenibacillus elgii]|uniref:hypothetical protein n=1 Tax=Paenibacillus elgii TaxID=189691 RepID=UPI000248E0A8|nr:hypothetical protein [Paenibacillus elgii]